MYGRMAKAKYVVQMKTLCKRLNFKSIFCWNLGNLRIFLIHLLSCCLLHRWKHIYYLSMMDIFSQLDKYFFFWCCEQLDKKQTDIFCRRVFFHKTSVKQKIGKRRHHFLHSLLLSQSRWALLVNILKRLFSFKGCSLVILLIFFLYFLH